MQCRRLKYVIGTWSEIPCGLIEAQNLSKIKTTLFIDHYPPLTISI